MVRRTAGATTLQDLVALAVPVCEQSQQQLPPSGSGRTPDIPDWLLAVFIMIAVLQRKKPNPRNPAIPPSITTTGLLGRAPLASPRSAPISTATAALTVCSSRPSPCRDNKPSPTAWPSRSPRRGQKPAGRSRVAFAAKNRVCPCCSARANYLLEQTLNVYQAASPSDSQLNPFTDSFLGFATQASNGVWKLSLTGLAKGTYKFWVQAVDSDGVYSTPVAVTVTVS